VAAARCPCLPHLIILRLTAWFFLLSSTRGLGRKPHSRLYPLFALVTVTAPFRCYGHITGDPATQRPGDHAVCDDALPTPGHRRKLPVRTVL
jgi:hypothetical protein